MKKIIIIFVMMAIMLLCTACTNKKPEDSVAPSNGLLNPVVTEPVAQSQEPSKTGTVSEAVIESVEDTEINTETLPATTEVLEINTTEEIEDPGEEGQGLEIVDEVIVDVSGDIVIGGN